jgi:GGDEF domain-containing protein
LRCSHQYQDYSVKAKCISCQFDNPVENLIAKEIRDYTITRKGISVAYNGFISTSKDYDEVPGTVKYDVFKIMLKYEIERLRQNDYTSNIGYVHISNAGQIYSRIGLDRQKSLIAELIGILRHNLRSADFISFYDASTLVLSMNEIPNKIANKILVEIANLTTTLMKRNFRNIEVEIKTFAAPLEIQISHELQLQNLMRTIDKTPIIQDDRASRIE